MATLNEATRNYNMEDAQRRLAATRQGIYTMIALDDLDVLGDQTATLLRRDIRSIYDRTSANGGTTLSFDEWKDAIRDGLEGGGR